jgi:hypothetical protein
VTGLGTLRLLDAIRETEIHIVPEKITSIAKKTAGREKIALAFRVTPDTTEKNENNFNFIAPYISFLFPFSLYHFLTKKRTALAVHPS